MKSVFHLGLHCLQKYPFTSIQNENGYGSFLYDTDLITEREIFEIIFWSV